MADHKKLVEFFESQGGALMSFALSLLKNRADAEDACQEMTLQMLRHWEQFDGNKSLKSWAYTILYRKCLDLLKKRRRFLSFFRKATSQMITEENEQPDNSWPACVSEKVFLQLSARERACLMLWAKEGFSAREIAGVLGLSPGTVRVHLYQARRKLKQLLERGNEQKVQLFSG